MVGSLEDKIGGGSQKVIVRCGIGDLAEQAQDIVERLDSYAEVSPSETGVHVIVEGELPADRRRSGDVEMYEEARYFTVTGAHLSLAPREVAKRSEALAAVHADVVADQGERSEGPEARLESAESPDESMGVAPEPSISIGSATEASETESESDAEGLDDEAVIEHASAAANGAKFRRLWRGNTSGYPSHSEADMALCCLLSFWTDGNLRQMDRLFRRSGLMREKWDEVHYADGRTYGEATVQRALRVTTERYEPGSGSEDGEREDMEPDRTAETTTAETAASSETAQEPDGRADVDTVVLVELEERASIAHLREENALLRERGREQRARIEALEVRLARDAAETTSEK